MLHTGDVIDNPEVPAEWDFAEEAMKNIEGVIPYKVLAGNHDIFHSEELFDEFSLRYGPNRYADRDQFIWYGENQACARILQFNVQKYLLIALCHSPSDEILAWTEEILDEYSDIPAIIATHSYLEADGKFTNDGSVIYSNIVKKHSNVRLVLCGHRYNVFQQIVPIDDNNDGISDRKVVQILANYQSSEGYGNGSFELMTLTKQKIL